MSDHSFPVLISAVQIQERVIQLARQIDLDYPEGTLYVIGILKGAALFVADLVRAIKRPVRLDFIGLSSYASGTASSGEVKLTKDIDVSLQDAHVLIVEDIVDSGVTLTYLLNIIEQRKPQSVRVIALLDKPERRQRPVEVHYVGFRIPDQFVVGYGLDLAEEYRGLRDICVYNG